MYEKWKRPINPWVSGRRWRKAILSIVTIGIKKNIHLRPCTSLRALVRAEEICLRTGLSGGAPDPILAQRSRGSSTRTISRTSCCSGSRGSRITRCVSRWLARRSTSPSVLTRSPRPPLPVTWGGLNRCGWNGSPASSPLLRAPVASAATKCIRGRRCWLKRSGHGTGP